MCRYRLDRVPYPRRNSYIRIVPHNAGLAARHFGGTRYPAIPDGQDKQASSSMNGPQRFLATAKYGLQHDSSHSEHRKAN